jgi:hypothetical protein
MHCCTRDSIACSTVLLLCSYIVCCNCGGLILPLTRASGPLPLLHTGRTLLRNGTMQVHGAVREGYVTNRDPDARIVDELITTFYCRYFYATLSLGTPPLPYLTIIDTGSTITYLPCINCKHCGEHTVSITSAGLKFEQPASSVASTVTSTAARYATSS